MRSREAFFKRFEIKQKAKKNYHNLALKSSMNERRMEEREKGNTDRPFMIETERESSMKEARKWRHECYADLH